MAGASPDLVVKIAANISALQADMAKAAGSIKTIEDAATQGNTATGLFQERWAGFAVAAGAAAVGVGQVVGQMRGWITASSEQENALSRLKAALEAQGTLTPALLAQYTDLATGLQNTTTHADELTIEMQALLVQVGHVMPDQMKGALQAAMNLAAGMKISLPEATTLLAKALGTGGESLGRLKGLLGDTTIAGKDTASVLAAVNEKFGGQAAAQAETYSGKLAILNNQYGEMKEKAGDLVLSVLTPLFNLFTSLPTSVQTTIAAGALLVGALAPLGLAIGGISTAISLLVPVLAVAAPVAIGALTAAFAVLAPFLLPAGAIILGIGAVYLAFKNWGAITEIARAVYEGVKGWLLDKFTAIVEGVKAKIDAVTGFFRGMYETVVGHSIIPDMVAEIGATMAQLPAVMVTPTQTAADGVVSVLASTAIEVKASLQSIVGMVQQVPQQVAMTNAQIMQMPRHMRPGENPFMTESEFTQKIVQDRANAPFIHRASGGPVSAGGSYMVGERGPELYTPGASGFITPLGAGGSGSSVTNIYITQPLGTPSAIAVAIREALAETHRTSGLRMPVGA